MRHASAGIGRACQTGSQHVRLESLDLAARSRCLFFRASRALCSAGRGDVRRAALAICGDLVCAAQCACESRAPAQRPRDLRRGASAMVKRAIWTRSSMPTALPWRPRPLRRSHGAPCAPRSQICAPICTPCSLGRCLRLKNASERLRFRSQNLRRARMGIRAHLLKINGRLLPIRETSRGSRRWRIITRGIA